MKHRAVRLATSALVVFAIGLAACSDGGNARVVVDGDEGEIEITATGTPSASATGIPEGSPTAEGSPGATATETPTGTPDPSATPTMTPTAVATPSAGSPAGDLSGLPFSTSDVRAAVQGARYTFNDLEGRAPLCADASVVEYPFWAGSTQGGTDYGFVYVLWLYPDEDALEADWAFEDGRLVSRAGCELPNGFVYFNANAVVAFDTWHSAGADTGPTDDGPSPGEHPAVEAFLGMTP